LPVGANSQLAAKKPEPPGGGGAPVGAASKPPLAKPLTVTAWAAPAQSVKAAAANIESDLNDMNLSPVTWHRSSGHSRPSAEPEQCANGPWAPSICKRFHPKPKRTAISLRATHSESAFMAVLLV
jgi:hypothetical protein